MKYENLEQRYGITLVSDRVVRKEASYSERRNFEFIRDLVNHLIMNPNPMVVPIYRFEVLEETPIEDKRTWGTYRYAYEMQRLPMLTNDEKELISVMIRTRWSFNNPTDPIVLRGQRELPLLAGFMNRVLSEDQYTDLHDQNFLKDEEGNYRIIDIEGFSRYPGIERKST